MNAINQTITLQVFFTTTLSGSSQSIYFVKTLAEINSPPEAMKPGVDYTVAYFDGDHQVNVVWRNHHNTIQLCGSAAYGVSYYLLCTLELSHLVIQSPHITLHAAYDSDISLYIPAKPISLASRQCFDYGFLYHHPQSGIYFVEVEDKDVLQQRHWTKEYLYALPLDEPHGICFFYWHAATKTGYLRYFTPWHGRIEDSVTGSIQSYLTPYVAQMYGATSLSWIQLSQGGGNIQTTFLNEQVRLRGNCRVQT